MAGSLIVMAGQSNAIALNGGNGGISVGEAYAGLTGSGIVTPWLVAANGAPLTFGRGEADWYNPGEMATTLVQTVRAALDADPDLVLAGIVWVQGEADSHAVARAGQYAARLEALVDRVASELAGYGERTADFRVSLLALSAQCPEGQTRAQWDLVRSQQLGIDHARISVIDPDAAVPQTLSPAGGMFQADGLHYTAAMNAALLPRLIEALNLRVTGGASSDTLRGGAGNDVLSGGAGRDRLSGGAGADTLWGGAASDVLLGGAGKDVIVGGGGFDTLIGGTGADRFVFFAEGIGAGAAADRITDFERGRDVIDLRMIDADVTRGGDQAFRLVEGVPRPGQPGAVWLLAGAEGTMVCYDTNGDGGADGRVFCAGVDGLGAADLLF